MPVPSSLPNSAFKTFYFVGLFHYCHPLWVRNASYLSKKWTFLPCWGQHPLFCLKEYKDKNSITLITAFFFSPVQCHSSPEQTFTKSQVLPLSNRIWMNYAVLKKEGEKRKRKGKKFNRTSKEGITFLDVLIE